MVNFTIRYSRTYDVQMKSNPLRKNYNSEMLNAEQK